jgi:hypothetical protein
MAGLSERKSMTMVNETPRESLPGPQATDLCLLAERTLDVIGGKR